MFIGSLRVDQSLNFWRSSEYASVSDITFKKLTWNYKVCLHQKLIIIKRPIFHEEGKKITFVMASLRVDHCFLFSLEAFLKTSEGEAHKSGPWHDVERQRHKMVKHTQTIRRQIAVELFECVWSFYRVGTE